MDTHNLDEGLIKQVYFYCENNRADGLYPNEVDLIEFGRKLAAVLEPIIIKEERERCVKFVSKLNKEVGKTLAGQSLKYTANGIESPEEDWAHYLQRISHLERHVTDSMNDHKFNMARDRLLEIEHNCRMVRAWIDSTN